MNFSPVNIAFSGPGMSVRRKRLATRLVQPMDTVHFSGAKPQITGQLKLTPDMEKSVRATGQYDVVEELLDKMTKSLAQGKIKDFNKAKISLLNELDGFGISNDDTPVPLVLPSSTSLENASLKGIDLSSLELFSADKKPVSLQGSDLSKADLIGAKLSKLNMQGIILKEAHLDSTDFSGSNLTGANLFKADFSRNSTLENATLLGADMRKISMIEGSLDGANLTGAKLQGADLGDLSMRNVILKDIAWKGASLAYIHEAEGTDFAGLDMTGVDLEYSTLTGALNLDKALNWDKAEYCNDVLFPAGFTPPGLQPKVVAPAKVSTRPPIT